MIAVIVPAHNEAEHIDACLASIQHAALHPVLRDEAVQCFVALDDCSDRTGFIAQRRGAALVVLRENNVGAARALGSRAAVAAGARWLAFTDADTVVAPDWLAAQLELRAEAVCGTVRVGDWRDRGAGVREHHDAAYNHDDGHRHVHGANLGVSTAAYVRAGGFAALVCNEDVALVGALRDAGVSIAWSSRPRVWTSARRDFKAPEGFGARLQRIERELARRASKPASDDPPPQAPASGAVLMAGA